LADPFLKKRKNGVLVVTGALMLVLAFWIYRVPHTHFYRTYRLKQRLRSFSLPPQTKVLTINDMGTVELPYGLVIDGITGFYSTNVDCDIVNTHYKAEFVRQGFSYVNEPHAPRPESAELRFSSPEFSASVSCTAKKGPAIYLIAMNWKTPRD